MKTDRARSTDVPGHGQEPDREDRPRGQAPTELDQLIERAGARFAVDLETLTRDLPRTTKPVAPPEEPPIPRPPERAGRRDVASALRPYVPVPAAESRRTATGAGPGVDAVRPAAPAAPGAISRPRWASRIGGLSVRWIVAGLLAALVLSGGLVTYRLLGQPPAPFEAWSEPSRPTVAPSQGIPAAAARPPLAAAGRPVKEPRAPAGQVGPAPPAPLSVAVTPSLPTAPTWRTLLDQRFAAQPLGWPNTPTGTAWSVDGAYRLFARQPPRFVAIDAPLSAPLGDVRVSATFRKVGGPAGGGAGLIVRGQTPGARDGDNQGSRYYVLEAGDRGEVGAWRREDDHWVDLLPWTPSATVRAGTATNDLTVEARGRRLTLWVNGVEAASVTDDALSAGAVGVFVGGDLNEVALERFVIESAG